MVEGSRCRVKKVSVRHDEYIRGIANAFDDVNVELRPRFLCHLKISVIVSAFLGVLADPRGAENRTSLSGNKIRRLITGGHPLLPS